MKPAIKKTASTIMRWCGTWYLLTAIIFGGLIHPETAALQRLNSLIFVKDYPLGSYTSNTPGDHNAFRNTILYYELLNSIAPSARGYEMVGYCYAQIKEHELAIANYKKALTLTPQFFWLKYNLAVIYYKQGEYQKAIPYFKSIAKTDTKELFIGTVFVNFSHLPLTERQNLYENLIDFASALQDSAILGLRTIKAKATNQPLPFAFEPRLVLHPLAYITVGKEELYGH